MSFPSGGSEMGALSAPTGRTGWALGGAVSFSGFEAMAPGFFIFSAVAPPSSACSTGKEWHISGANLCNRRCPLDALHTSWRHRLLKDY